MRLQQPTFWLLDGPNGWCTDQVSDTSASEHGIRLAAVADGPLGLASPDGALGGLLWPRGMALDDQGRVLLLLPTVARIKHLDPSQAHFQDLPGIGGLGSAARRLREPTNIATADGLLYVADRGNQRVQVFDLRTLTLHHLWGPGQAFADPGGIIDAEHWDPVDLTVVGGQAYILDRRHARVYHHRPGRDRPVTLFQVPGREQVYQRIAVDRECSIYLLDAEDRRLDIFDANGRFLGEARDPDEVRHRFVPPPVRLDHQGRFCLPQGLVRECNRGASAPLLENPLAACLPPDDGGLVFDRDGHPVSIDPAERPGPPLYKIAGEWFSQPLNSQIHRCQWHRIELELADLPVGTRVEIRTYTEDEANGTCHELSSDEASAQDFASPPIADHLWKTHYAAAGPMQAPSAEPLPSTHEFLVQSREGQHLRLRLILQGDGYATPVVRALRVHYPRQTYLDHLPAVYAQDDNSRWFLERFLAVFQTEWERLEQHIEELPALFDPEAVPSGDLLVWLADLMGLSLEKAWTDRQKRRLLAAAPRLYQSRGTLHGLTDWLRVYLANFTGLATERIACSGYPRLIEGFRERRHLMLARSATGFLGLGAPLWGPGRVGRLQTDVYARTGEVRLVSTGDPQRDLFHEYAHRFRVFVPAAWVRTAQHERMLRHALDTEKPAHTEYELCLVESRFQIGVRSTLGVDSIIGDYPRTRLHCAPEFALDWREDENAPPPSLPLRDRLGIDTVLSGVGGRPHGLRLGPTERLAAGIRLH